MRYRVGLEVWLTVEAESPDAAIRAMRHKVPDAESIKYSVCEEAERLAAQTATLAEPYSDLTKCVYKVHEVAEILGISRHSVYERVPCIRVGSRRLYPKATLIDILQNGLKTKGVAITEVQTTDRGRTSLGPAHVVRNSAAETTEIPAIKRLTMKDAATMLRLSVSKTKELFDTKKIYCSDSYGKRVLQPQAIEHYLAGGTALQYVEMLIQRARSDPYYNDKQDIVDRFELEMREKWAGGN